MTFEEFGLSPEILKAIARMGFETPTPVQAQVIPRLLENRGDLVALAQTGTGKTAAFGLPILNMLDHKERAPQALVLCPTRELCVQIARDMAAFAACSPAVSLVAVYGGAPIQTQMRSLDKGAQIIVATPGRMLDILRRQKADLRGVKRVILDEADEMLNMGFQEELEAIMAQVPDGAHTLLFSATMPRQVATMARTYMKHPEEITIGQRNAGAENVTHECYVVHQRDRYRALKRIADYYPDMYAIVFCRTRLDTQSVADWLIRDGYNAEALHGDLTQVQRDRVMEKFRSRSLQILVATDVAARGLDVNDLTHVINYSLPDDLGSYTHRSGRTGRAGKSGVSAVIINMREKGNVHRIEKMIGKTFTYRDVPSGREICEAQLFSRIERMKRVTVDDKLIGSYLPGIYASLEGMDWKEIVKRFVVLEFTQLLSYYRGAENLSPGEPMRRAPTTDRRTKTEEPVRRAKNETPAHTPRKEGPAHTAKKDGPAHTAKKDGSERPPVHASGPRGVRMFINLGSLDGFTSQNLSELISREGGRGVSVSRIDIMKKYSFFDVPFGEAEMVIMLLGAAHYKGRSVRVEPVDDETRGKRVKRTERRKEVRGRRPGVGQTVNKGGASTRR